MNRPVSLIGAPTDIGAGTRGASMGPEALRVAGLRATLESLAPRYPEPAADLPETVID